MYKNTANLVGFLGKDAEVKAAHDSSTEFHCAQPDHKRELQKQTNK
jgi:hypothetical protein